MAGDLCACHPVCFSVSLVRTVCRLPGRLTCRWDRCVLALLSGEAGREEGAQTEPTTKERRVICRSVRSGRCSSRQGERNGRSEHRARFGRALPSGERPDGNLRNNAHMERGYQLRTALSFSGPLQTICPLMTGAESDPRTGRRDVS